MQPCHVTLADFSKSEKTFIQVRKAGEMCLVQSAGSNVWNFAERKPGQFTTQAKKKKQRITHVDLWSDMMCETLF